MSELVLSQHLEHFESLAGEVSDALRSPWLRERAARPLSRAVRELLARTFHALESIRTEHAAHLDTPAPAGLRRRLFQHERDLDAARQLLADARPAPLEPQQQRSLRYFEMVGVRVPESLTLRCTCQGYRLGQIGDAMLALTGDIERRVQRFLDVLATDKAREREGLETQRTWSAKLLPDYWDLDLIKRSKQSKNKGS